MSGQKGAVLDRASGTVMILMIMGRNGTLQPRSETDVLVLHLGGVVALSVECRTCDQEVVGSSLGRARG